MAMLGSIVAVNRTPAPGAYMEVIATRTLDAEDAPSRVASLDAMDDAERVATAMHPEVTEVPSARIPDRNTEPSMSDRRVASATAEEAPAPAGIGNAIMPSSTVALLSESLAVRTAKAWATGPSSRFKCTVQAISWPQAGDEAVRSMLAL